jgi:hypothetical protein
MDDRATAKRPAITAGLTSRRITRAFVHRKSNNPTLPDFQISRAIIEAKPDSVALLT